MFPRKFQDIFGSLFRKERKSLRLWLILSDNHSPLCKVLITMKIVWENEKNIRILQEKVSKVNFKCYEDESAEIRKTIRAIEADESDTDTEDTETNDEVFVDQTKE